jgi:hypothetical protein
MGITSTVPNLPKTAFPRYMPMVGPSDDSASNPGMFISHLLIVFKFDRHGKSPSCSQCNPGYARCPPRY